MKSSKIIISPDVVRLLRLLTIASKQNSSTPHSYHPPHRTVSVVVPDQDGTATVEGPATFIIDESGPYDPSALSRPTRYYQVDDFEEMLALYAAPLPS